MSKGKGCKVSITGCGVASDKSIDIVNSERGKTVLYDLAQHREDKLNREAIERVRKRAETLNWQ